MTQRSRHILRDYLLGLCFGILGAALVWHFAPGPWKQPRDAALQAALQQQQASMQQQLAAAGAAQEVAQPAPRQAASLLCGFDPLVPPAGAADGSARMEHPFPADARARARVFLRAADTAAAAGRLRDEEVALIAACRQHQEASKRPNIPLARILGRLGERYAAVARDGRAAEVREQVLARAAHVLALSADAYASALGPNAARSREARLRAQTFALQETHDMAAPQEAFVPLEPAVASSPAPLRAAAVQRKPDAARTVRAAPPPGAAISAERPARAGHAKTTAIDSPELSQLASDLARLQEQAEGVTDDPDGMRLRTAAAHARRDRCQDAACLRAWHAQRRRELLQEF